MRGTRAAATGLRVRVLYEGFGEDALNAATADETEEVRNRRAEYIVAIEPRVVSQVRPASWKQLRWEAPISGATRVTLAPGIVVVRL